MKLEMKTPEGVVELTDEQLDEVGGGIAVLLFGAGVLIGAGIYLATEYLT